MHLYLDCFLHQHSTTIVAPSLLFFNNLSTLCKTIIRFDNKNK